MNPLTIELTPTISLLEMLYTVGGFAAFLYAFVWTRRAQADRDGLVREGLNGGRMIATRINLVIGWCMMAKLSLYVVVGVAQMTVEPLQGTPTLQATISGLCFLAAQYLAVYLLYKMNHLYVLMVNYYDRSTPQRTPRPPLADELK